MYICLYAKYANAFLSSLLVGISGQVEPVRPVPKRLEEFSKEELENFPKFWDFPEEYVIK